MPFHLIESVKDVLSGDMTNKIAGILGESSSNVNQALQGIIPSIMTGVLLKVEAGEAQESLKLATDASRLDIPYNLNSLAGGNGSARGMDFLKIIFGEKISNLTAAISKYAGISPQSALALMSITVPVSLGVLGKHILDSNMNDSGLRSFLKGQRRKILDALPTSLLLEGIFGTEQLTGLAERFSTVETAPKKSPTGSKWVWFLVLGLVLAAWGIWYFSNLSKPAVVSAQKLVDTSTHSPKDTSALRSTVEGPLSMKLPDGTQFMAKKGGLEDQLLVFLNDPGSKPSRRYPFNFDELEFTPGTDVITGESMTQIKNIAMVLKAFPKVKIKIGGFNEKGGDSVANLALSENRAIAVATALRTAGAAKNQVISAEGFGSDYAKYPEDAPDSLKRKDERIAISVRAK